jgi:hypothetical protein
MARIMASSPRSFHIFCTLVLSSLSFVSAAPWIVTSYYELDLYTAEGYTDTDFGITYSATIESQIVEITPTASVSPLTTSTIVISNDEYDGGPITVVEVLFPSVPAAAAATTTTMEAVATSTRVYTSYYVNLVYTAPASCSTSWVSTTAVPVDVPYEIEGAIKPTSVSTSYSTDNSQPFQPVTITQAMAYIAPSQLPSSSLSELSSQYGPYTIYDGSVPCSYYSSGSGSSSSGDSSSSNDGGYYYGDNTYWLYDSYYGISPLGIILICVLGWFGLFLIIGLIENYFQFQRLMKGWQARRGLPISWCMLAPIVSCILLAFSRKGFQARTEDEAKEMKTKWDETGFWKKVGLWLQWGFRWKYPPMLPGPAPARVGRPSKRPVPVTPLLRVSPPPSAESQTPRPSIGGDPEGSSPDQREMSQVEQPPPQTLQVPLSSSRPTAGQSSSPSHPANQQDDEITAIPSGHGSS